MYCTITDQMMELLRSLQDARKKPLQHRDCEITSGELYFLQTVHRFPDEKAKALARRLQITPGAAAQIISRLTGKGLLDTLQRAENKREKYFRLTPFGAEMLSHIQQVHQAANHRICQYIEALSPEEKDTIFHFLHMMQENVPFCPFPCKCYVQSSDEGADHHETDTHPCAKYSRHP